MTGHDAAELDAILRRLDRLDEVSLDRRTRELDEVLADLQRRVDDVEPAVGPDGAPDRVVDVSGPSDPV